MKRGSKIALGVVATLVVAAGAVYLLARSSEPLVPLERDPENEDEAALREVLHAIGDPRELEDGQRVTLRLTQRQVSALAAEASRRRARVSGRARLREGAVDVTLSAESPRAWLTPYVNVRATIHGPPSAPRVEAATLGDLPIPAALGQVLLDYGRAELAARDPIAAAALAAVEEVDYGADVLTVRVRWSEELRAQLREAGREVVAQELGGDRLSSYFEVLRRALEEGGGRPERTLAELMPPLFAAAREAVAGGGDPRREVEAAIVALTLYSLEHPLDDVLGERAPAPLPRHRVLLHGRTDLTKHFLVSAATTLFADRAVASALGLAKELRDAEAADGSGFSFADLAADRAGTRLMEEGTRSPARLDALLGRLARPLEDLDLAPAVDDLPEGMDAAAFRAAYEDVESEAFRALVAQIDRRTDEGAVLRDVRAAP